MSGLITHLLLDQYESVSGELEKLQTEDRPDAALWDLLDDCLLYTSDAADERSSVDLGGRRIIKKKKKKNTYGLVNIKTI